MPTAIKRLAGPLLLTTAAATLYTVPAATTVTLRDIEFCNETAAAVTVTLSIGTDAAGKRLFRSRTVPANGNVQWTGNVQLEAAEFIQALASANTAVTIIIGGVVQS
jgi:hypothetical protein